MLSLLSGQVVSSSSGSFVKVSGDRRANNTNGRSSKISAVHRSSLVGSHLTSVNFLIISLLAAGTLIQCNEAKNSDYATQDWKPCICNSTFYKYCPKASQCIENNIENLSKMTQGPNVPNQLESFLEGADNYHDDMDPDHVENPPSFSLYGSNKNPSFGIDEDKIVRHRKVYVARKKQRRPQIETLSIRIPLEIPTIEPTNIPDPKPMYKLKKYTTYENRPEIQMVPVTKTIIKPVGVSQDQIIGDGADSIVA